MEVFALHLRSAMFSVCGSPDGAWIILYDGLPLIEREDDRLQRNCAGLRRDDPQHRLVQNRNRRCKEAAAFPRIAPAVVVGG